jgi:hypothetical protein
MGPPRTGLFELNGLERYERPLSQMNEYDKLLSLTASKAVGSNRKTSRKFPANRENYREFAISSTCERHRFCSPSCTFCCQNLRQKRRIEQGNSRATSGSSWLSRTGNVFRLDAGQGVRTVFAVRPSSSARSCSLSQSSGRVAAALPKCKCKRWNLLNTFHAEDGYTKIYRDTGPRRCKREQTGT